MAKNVSADAPDFFLLPNVVVNSRPASPFSVVAAGPVRGAHACELSVRDKTQLTPREPHPCLRFDPVTSRLAVQRSVPAPLMKDTLDESRVFRFRSHDGRAFENRHRCEIERNRTTFYRCKGSLESYLEKAHHNRDMLVCQPAQSRGATRRRAEGPNNTLAASLNPMGSTAALATSAVLRNRHIRATSTAGQMHSTAPTAPQTRMGRSQSALSMSLESCNGSETTRFQQPELVMLQEFEKTQHGRINFRDMTKAELKELIESEGLETPGKVSWDGVAGCMVKGECRKQEYLDAIKQHLVDSDDREIVRRIIRIGQVYCIVSLFKHSLGGVRIVAYDQVNSHEYKLSLTTAQLEALDIRRPPVVGGSDNGEYDNDDDDNNGSGDDETYRRWIEWSRPWLMRLKLSSDGDLFCGPQELSVHGLPRNFTLIDENVNDTTPSRVKITAFFDAASNS
jgi:hypothetical protein